MKGNLLANSIMNRPLRMLLLGSVSALSVGLLMPAQAQSTGTSATKDSEMLETVTVTARRAAMQSAQQIKESSNQIVDSIVADDAGKLPDNSVTEVLARVPGVTIGRFQAVNDPDHFSIEGSGVAVRGLTQVSSSLNGRNSFSANGGRALLWEDVPPELMAAVSVYKSSTADQIEGGIGGSVDLRTHMPFDYDGLKIFGSVAENYGDFVDQGRPAASLLVSNRWNTRVGEIGLLFDVAYSDISSRYDTFQIEPYFQQTLYSNPDGSPNAAGVPAFIPGGFDWRTSGFDRKRIGVYEALQWKVTDRLTVFQTFFQSAYHQDQYGLANYYANGTSETVPVGAIYTLSPSNVLTSTSALNYTGSDGYTTDPHQHCTVANCTYAFNNTGVSNGNNRTTDVTSGFQWDVSDSLFVTGALQYVHSTGSGEGMDLFTQAMVSNISMKMNGNDLPTIKMTDPSLEADPTRATWDAVMDHAGRTHGSQIAANLDSKYEFGHEYFIRAVKGGVRYSNQKERDVGGSGGKYNWHSLTPAWLSCCTTSPWNYLVDARPGDTQLVKFDNFFRGEVPVPSQSILPSLAFARQYNPIEVATLYGYVPWGMNTNPNAVIQEDGSWLFLPQDVTVEATATKAAYLMAEFGLDDVFGMAMDGNIGVRVVNNANKSSGYITQTGGVLLIDTHGTVLGTSAAVAETRSGGYHYTKALPSFNIQLMPRDDIHIRLALSQSMANPNFNQMYASGSAIAFNGCPGAPGGGGAGVSVIDPTGACYVGTTTMPLGGSVNGNPYLKPQISDNFDLSAEWYGQNQAAVHLGLFYKAVHNFMSYGAFNALAQARMPDGSLSIPLALQYTGWYNQQGVATIRGFEIGGTKFFDFLPAPFDGIGVEGNFTYIDSRSPGSQSCQLFPGATTSTLCGANEPITRLPVEQLSKYNYNLTLMYEKDSWSGRIAYNWRSKYLLVASGANGTRTLPVFSAPYGQLDGGVSYKINDMFTVQFNGQNLLHTTAFTLMGYHSPTQGNQQNPRNWFVSDVRYELSLKFAY